MSCSQLEIDHFEEFIGIVDGGSETKIHRFLDRHPFIWQCYLALNRTGHHDFRVLSKQMISPHIPEVRRGMIPDYIVGGKNSDGWRYFVVELKSPAQTVFVQSQGAWRLSRDANKGIVQLLVYVDFCIEYQGVLRDAFQLKGFREPVGILLMDREETYKDCDIQRGLKRAWNLSVHNLELRTYDSFLRSVRIELEQRKKLKALRIREKEEEREIGDREDVRSEIEYMRDQFGRDCLVTDREE